MVSMISKAIRTEKAKKILYNPFSPGAFPWCLKNRIQREYIIDLNLLHLSSQELLGFLRDLVNALVLLRESSKALRDLSIILTYSVWVSFYPCTKTLASLMLLSSRVSSALPSSSSF